MSVGEVIRVIVLFVFAAAILLAALSVLLDEGMKSLRDINGVLVYLFVIGGAGAAGRQCFDGISDVIDVPTDDIVNFLFRTLPASITVLAIIGFFIWCKIDSIKKKKK